MKIYCYVCEQWEEKLQYCCQRFSNNNPPAFTDQEAVCIYLYCMSVERRFRVKDIYGFASLYLRSWFPRLPSYVAFVNRMNRLNEALRLLAESVLTDFQPEACDTGITLVDSMPVITCSGKRRPKVAGEMVTKGYCSTRDMYYYGLKLHAAGYRRRGHLPFPARLILTEASVNDLTLLKSIGDSFYDTSFFGDRDCWKLMAASNRIEMLTPVKSIPGESEWEKQRNRAWANLYSAAVSSVRQPVESLFNRLIEKTDIQRAAKVRSSKGLLTFIFGRIAAPFIFLVF
ncbi:MAG: transposase [Tannerella sp.]|nr:transposase [Tannerella sp.]